MMQAYLPEKIGRLELFSGRNKELDLFQRWIQDIPKGISRSRALLSRRKTGKTALMQRLYNLTFEKNTGVIPFYYEIREGKIWAVDFCRDFYLTFIYQYIAYKTRKPQYVNLPSQTKHSFTRAAEIAQKEGLEYLIGDIEGVDMVFRERHVDTLWLMVREAPFLLADRQHEYIVQMIDEFQYFNSEIYWDEAKTQLADTFAAGYMSTAEYRNAPLLISGSYIGWLKELLHTMLPSRFKQYELRDMPEDEAVEMVHNYARIYEVPITEDVAYSMAKLCEGNPFYVSAVFESDVHGKDLTTRDGLLETLEYETLHSHGHIRLVWMEYLGKVFYQVNQQNAKNIVFHLSQHRDREISRRELLRELSLDISEGELEERAHALIKADIIEQGRSNFYYRGVQDNIFDKVFRGQYADDIRSFDPQEIRNEYRAMYEQAKEDLHSMTGKYSQIKGQFAEFAVINQLRLHAIEKQDLFRSITHSLPEDFRFVEYSFVWSYKIARQDRRDVWIDVFACAGEADYSFISEIKYRKKPRFSLIEAEEFLRKAQVLQKQEQLTKTVLFVLCSAGFAPETLDYFNEHRIAYSDDERWLG
ncbi:MAG: hypothetical protein GY801_29240 [bacterium]|nr:hypothetical protein [bacterium]